MVYCQVSGQLCHGGGAIEAELHALCCPFPGLFIHISFVPLGLDHLGATSYYASHKIWRVVQYLPQRIKRKRLLFSDPACRMLSPLLFNTFNTARVPIFGPDSTSPTIPFQHLGCCRETVAGLGGLAFRFRCVEA